MVGVKNFTRGLTPAGVGVTYSYRGFEPGRGRGQNFFVGVKNFCRGLASLKSKLNFVILVPKLSET